MLNIARFLLILGCMVGVSASAQASDTPSDVVVVAEQSTKEDSATTQSDGETICSLCKKFWRALTFKPVIEQLKFYVLQLRDITDDLEKTTEAKALQGKKISYRTGNQQGDDNYYKGTLTINNVDYGKVVHNKTSPQQEWEAHERSLSEQALPFNFICETANEFPATFSKGTPVLKGSFVHIDYEMHNTDGTKYIRVSTFRSLESQAFE